MKRVCAWCGKDIESTQYDDRSDPIITHGICEVCKTKALLEMEFDLQEFLNSMDDPIIIVDKNAVILAGNSKAEQLLGMAASELIGMSLGKTFKCENVFDETLCGSSENCPTCELRAHIENTHDSGSGKRNIPVSIHTKEAYSSNTLNMKISSEKMGNNILLRIDQINKN